MENNILGYITVVNTAVWVIPLIVTVFMLIKKKFKFKSFFMGLLTYIALYAVKQILLTAVSLPFSGVVGDSIALGVTIYAISVPPVMVLGTYFMYKKLDIGNEWFETVGYGIGFSYASLIAELGIKLFGNMLMAVMISEGNMSGLEGEQLEAYKNIKAVFEAQSVNFYISIGIAAVMIFVSNMVNLLLLRKYSDCGKKFPIVFAYILYTVMYALFTIAVYVGIEHWIVMVLMAAVTVYSVYYLTKSYDMQEIDTEYVSRPSPLLGRNVAKRYKKRK